MLVMISNQSGIMGGYLAGKYEGSIGHLYSPGGQKGPYRFLPYALDNGKFSVWSRGQEWDRDQYVSLLEWAKRSGQRPLWVLGPDSVAEPEETLDLWAEWKPILEKYRWPLAFAVQDGHEPRHVPDCEVVFIGGTDFWKQKAIPIFTEAFERVHVGRVNGMRMLQRCAAYGVESVDGTGWFRGGKLRLLDLEVFLEEQKNGNPQLHFSRDIVRKNSTP